MKRLLWIIICATVVLAAVLVPWREPIVGVLHKRDEATSKAGKTSSGSEKSNSKDKAATVLRKIMESGEGPQLSQEQLRAFVDKHQHDSGSLLTAWQLGHDNTWLDEAVERYPNNPRVVMAKLSTFNELDGDAKEWIERLKQIDPQNSAGWCYDALSEFKIGSPEAGRAALAEAAKCSRFDGYSKESTPMLAEAYRSTGMDSLVAEVLGGFSTALPHVTTGMNVAREAIAKLRPDLDDATMQNILALAKKVRGADGTGYLMTDLVSSAMERKMLNELSGLELVPGTKKLVLERMAELDTERNLIKDLLTKTQPLLFSLDDSEMKQYYRRVTVEGELKAMKWLLARHPEVK